MPPQIYAGLLLSLISLGVFTLARFILADIIDPKTIGRWRNLFVSLMAVSFFVGNFWFAMLAAALLMIVFSIGVENKTALAIIAMFAMPDLSRAIGGFGSINTLFSISVSVLVAVVLLGPSMVKALGRSGRPKAHTFVDIFVFGYIGLVCVLAFRDVSFTAGVRAGMTYFLSIAPFYFVFSRTNWTVERLNELSAAFVCVFCCYGLIAAHEFVIGWQHFYEVAAHWDADVTARRVARAGFTRTEGPFFGSIAFGSFLMIGFIFAMPLLSQMKQRAMGLVGLGVIGFGLLSTISRGPWMGTFVGLFMKECFGPKGAARAVRLLMAASLVGVMLLLTPFGRRMFSVIPGIGDDEIETFDYRQKLFEIGSQQVMENPIFGSTDYLNAPRMQELVQGQGIIDIVNAYLRIALDHGLVGLFAYLAVLGTAIFAVGGATRRARSLEPELLEHSLTSFGALTAFSVLMVTTTMERFQSGELNWVLIGLAIGVARTIAVKNTLERSGLASDVHDAPASPTGVVKEVSSPASSLPPSTRTPRHLQQYLPRDD